MERVLAFDVTRLFIGPLRAAPRGIDRVELGYHRYIFERWAGPRYGVLPTPWGVRLFDGERIARGLRALEHLWQEGGGSSPDLSPDPSPDASLDAVRLWLAAGPTSFKAESKIGRRRPVRRRPVRGFYDLVRATGFSFGESVGARLPKGALHLNIGQIGIAWPPLTRWLEARPDVVSIMMLHDVIPLERPDLVKPSYPRLHANMVAAVSRRANGLIVNSEAAGAAVRRRLAAPRIDLRMSAVHLPVAPVFHRRPEPARDATLAPYFVVYGAIEVRKNHRLLFRVWHDLVAEHGGRAPRLVVAGSAAWGGRKIIEDLERDPVLSAHVAVLEGLSTAALVTLLRSAVACLAPSLAEGFGLPVTEALALGVPVIASAIPAHQEVARGHALLLGLDDRRAWVDAVAAYAFDGGKLDEARRRARAFEGTTWDTYAVSINAFLRSF